MPLGDLWNFPEIPYLQTFRKSLKIYGSPFISKDFWKVQKSYKKKERSVAMQYAYFLEVQKYEERNNQKVFQIIKELELPEEQVFCDDNPDDRTELKNLIDILEEDGTSKENDSSC